jgi:hypothetical protein
MPACTHPHLHTPTEQSFETAKKHNKKHTHTHTPAQQYRHHMKPYQVRLETTYQVRVSEEERGRLGATERRVCAI